MRVRGLLRVEVGGQPPPLQVQDQRVPGAGLPLPHRAVQQGPHPHCLRAFMGTQTTCF